MNFLVNKDIFKISSFFIIVLFLTRQFPLNSYSFLMNVSVLLFFASFKYFRRLKYFILIFIILLTLNFLFSILSGNTINNALRFYVILIFIILAYLENKKKEYVEIFLFFIFIQSIVLIVFHIYLNVLGFSNGMAIRFFFQEKGWGDIYSYNGYKWNIQLIGNALLPFGFFISYYYLNGNKRLIFLLILFLGIIISGNFAFYIGIFSFILIDFIFVKRYTFNIYAYFFLAIIIFLLITPYVLDYLNYVFILKGESSNPVRIDQINVLFKDFTESVFNFLFGKGLGNTISINTFWRDYTDDVYFEIQSLYILNQLGFFLFVYFLICNIILVKRNFKSIKQWNIYGSYIIYGLFNPYIFDTSHIVVIIVTKSIYDLHERKNISSNSIVQSEFKRFD